MAAARRCRLFHQVKAAGGGDNELCMEFAFREREPADRNVVPMIKEFSGVLETLR